MVQEDFDLKLVMDSKEISAETGEVTVKGSANVVGGEAVEFEGTIKNIKLKYEMGTKFNT